MSSTLNTFDDRTIKRAREKYTNGKRGSGDDPIATHAKVAQDVLLSNLQKLIARAENKAYDTTKGLQGELDAQSLIDPFLSYDENAAIIQDEYNVTFESYAANERDDRIQAGNEQSRRHAQEWLEQKAMNHTNERDNPATTLQAAVDGHGPIELQNAVIEIIDEFGESLVIETIAILEAEFTTELEGAPEPTIETTVSNDEFVDDRDEQATLDVGDDANRTRDREPKIEGSRGFIDRREIEETETDQSQLVEEDDRDDEQLTLTTYQEQHEAVDISANGEVEAVEPVEPPLEFRLAYRAISRAVEWAKDSLDSDGQLDLEDYSHRSRILPDVRGIN